VAFYGRGREKGDRGEKRPGEAKKHHRVSRLESGEEGSFMSLYLERKGSPKEGRRRPDDEKEKREISIFSQIVGRRCGGDFRVEGILENTSGTGLWDRMPMII